MSNKKIIVSKPKLIDFNQSYNPSLISNNLYSDWISNNLFKPNNSKQLYSCVMAPPNLTGVLHIGHAWELSLADAYLRFKKMQGFNVSWAPGYDHAGISTQAKFEKTLNQTEYHEYLKLTRKERIKKIEDWSIQNSSKIVQQMKLIGVSADWDNFHFTLDENSQIAVKKAFKNLYDKKYIYQETKLVNWDVTLNTAISNIEVQNKPIEQNMYYINYQIANSKDKLVIATTRPETIFVDAALFVNPKDKRYSKFIGKFAINPLTNKEIPILSDSYVDINFGTGVMKCTPAHDINDYKLGKKYKLSKLSCIDFDGKLNNYAMHFKGMDRIASRKEISNYLNDQNKLVKVEKIVSNVGYSERSDSIIEPLLSKQWFIKLSAFGPKLKKAIKTSKEFEMIPKTFVNLLNKWLNSCEDWCISRQLIWGHQIPVWYHKKTKKIYVDIKPPKNIKDYVQDPDVLDTWFSSSLWPLICYGWPNKNSKLFKNGYPNNLMIMGFDILFFWGIKMMFQGIFHTNKLPFNKLLIHGLIRDKNGKKMSKSLGNVIDPIDLIDLYGIDALRIYLTSNTSLGEDTNYQEEKIQDASNFLNKLWNASKYIFKLTNENQTSKNYLKIDFKKLNDADKWILIQYNKTLKKVTDLLSKFEFSLANKYLYNFIWNEFCNIYLEFSKVTLDSEEKLSTLNTFKYILFNICHLLHPFAPFITERIYQALMNDANKYLLKNKWPNLIKQNLSSKFHLIIEIISVIRNFRNEIKLPKNQPIKIKILVNNQSLVPFINKSINYLKLVNCEVLGVYNKKTNELKGKTLILKNFVIFVENQEFSIALQEILEKKIKNLEFEVERSKKILSNKQFLKNAPVAKINQEKEKLINYELELKKAISELKK
ncbi:valine--tRNA ligase [Mycoplasmoides pirum]|uniref:valine--tRNA ligase n=1 Tax=Mycoplasmoides pirum TaxID=2122 RepID=UPI0006978D22|nr:valine--tRNA ligase [Mycoplasmoides pirum]